MIAAQRVEVVPDWLTYTSAAATVVAAGLALFSVIYSGKQARKAERALLQERRADFELGLLAEMGRQFGITGIQHVHGHLLALVRETAADDDLPLLRAYFGRYPTEAGTRTLNALREVPDQDSKVRQLAGLEIEQAIERRLRSR